MTTLDVYLNQMTLYVFLWKILSLLIVIFQLQISLSHCLNVSMPHLIVSLSHCLNVLNVSLSHVLIVSCSQCLIVSMLSMSNSLKVLNVSLSRCLNVLSVSMFSLSRFSMFSKYHCLIVSQCSHWLSVLIGSVFSLAQCSHWLSVLIVSMFHCIIVLLSQCSQCFIVLLC